jgi:peptide/nickel transport system substrate-binding protein
MQDFDMHMAVWGGNSAADDFSQIWKTESWKNHGDNYTGFGNATTDALIDSCRFIVDEKIRVPLVKRFQKIVYDEQPYILLLANTRRVIIHKRFANANVYLQKPHVALNHLQLLKQ